MTGENILGGALSIIFADFSDQVLEERTEQELRMGFGPHIIAYKDNGAKVLGEAPFIPNEYAMDISRINTKPEPEYPYIKVSQPDGPAFI